jgi:preprotein translocase subunit SecA
MHGLCRHIRRVEEINTLEPRMRALPDASLAGKTRELRGRLRGGASLDALLPEALGLVSEAVRRMLGMRHCDVQLWRFSLLIIWQSQRYQRPKACKQSLTVEQC